MKKIMVANRGEIACRIFRTCERLGIGKLAVYSAADADSQHVRMADHAVCVGDSPPADSYLNVPALIAAAQKLGADAIHTGYGFLSENVEFARKVTSHGLVWIGPDPAAMEAMAEKVRARAIMHAAGVPVVPGTDAVPSVEDALEGANQIGYPVMLKASSGGGGIGMSIAHTDGELRAAFASTRSRAERFFSEGTVYIEKYIARARHVEVQILSLNSGQIVVVGDRDCSAQRRHQKVLEEAPCPGLTDVERGRLHEIARQAAMQVDYRGAGTIEMLLDVRERNFYFLEMNTRLQVEHPVTEMVTGIDLVESQIRIAAGEELDLTTLTSLPAAGHAVEFRVYAEDPKRFLPGPGKITDWKIPSGVGIRVDSGYDEGDTVSAYYDPLMAKLCAHGPDRQTAITRLRAAAEAFIIRGPKNNLALVSLLANDPGFRFGDYDTSVIERVTTTPKPSSAAERASSAIARS